MKMKCFIAGLAIGMVAAVIITETCPPVKKMIAAGKRKLKRFVEDED